MLKDPSFAIADARVFISENLTELASELMVYNRTGDLPDGKVRELANILLAVVSGPQHLGMAFSMIATACVEAVADNGKH